MSTLDEFDDDDYDWTAPGTFLIEELQMQREEVAAFKRKLCFGRKGGKKRKAGSDDEEGFVDDYESDSSPPGSPVYAESGESTSDNDGEFQLASDVNYCQQPVISFYAKVMMLLEVMDLVPMQPVVVLKLVGVVPMLVQQVP